MAIGIGLYHGHDAGAGRFASDYAQVMPDSAESNSGTSPEGHG
jgi:hypothetical protein